MSHYQHNINTPQFPPGAHLSHYSLTNTTLIGQEVQQRLWERYWGQQYAARPSPYLWPHPGVYCYGYPYGFPGIFSPVSLQRGLEQLQRPVLWQIEERGDNDTTGRVGKHSLESNRGQNVLVEVLEEGNGWSTNRNQAADKHEKDVYPVRQKIVDPVTDDLNWNKFSSDLADGIVVSILDSFVLDLPVLHFSTVQSVFDSLEKNAPQTEDQLISKPSAEKAEYFKDILIFTPPRVEQTQDKNSESGKTTATRQRGGSPKGNNDSDEIGVMPNSDACKITDRALEHCVTLNSPRTYYNQDFLQASDNVPESILYACKETNLTERYKAGKSIVYALKEADSPTSGDHKANRVGSGTTARTQRDGRSSGLNTIGKIFHESAEYSSVESAKSNDNTNSDPKEECNSPNNVRGWDKLPKTSQEECHSPKSATSSGKTQDECHSTTHITGNTESIANEYGNLEKCLLTDVRTEKASNVEDPIAKNTSSD